MTTLPDLRVRPGWRFMMAHPAHVAALGLGAGLSPVAPGSMGTLLAFPLYWIAARHLEPWPLLGLIAALFALGTWAAGRTGRALGVADHPGIVVDEVAAFMLVLFFTPPGPFWPPFAFLLFRLFDIFKPPPIRQADASVKGGFGVMLDDLLAAFYAILCLALAKAALG